MLLRRIFPAVAILAAAAGIASADAMDDELSACKMLLLSGRPDEAAVRLQALETKGQSVVSGSPTDAHGQYILGMAAMYLGHDDKAKAALDAAVRIEPQTLAYVMGRAQLALYTSAPADAVKLLSDALPLNPKNVELLEMLGHAQRDTGKLADAQDSYLAATALAPREPRYLAEVAECMVGQQKLDDALTTYQKALAIDPKYTVAWLSMSRIYQSRQDWDQAIDALRQVLAIDPSDYRTQARIVQLCEAAGKTKDRDAARDAMFQMHKAGKDTEDSFCREQFNSAKNLVVVMEYFDFTGPQAVRYAFNVATPDGKDIEKRISLGSYSDVTAAARQRGEIQPNEKMYHLDIYTEDGHEVLKTFTREPTYEETRDLVKQYLTGTLKPLPAASAPASTAATEAKP